MPDLDSGDPRMIVPLQDRLFDGAPAVVQAFALGQEKTARLVEHCRAERTTVNALIVAAAARSRAASAGKEYLRVVNPIDVRPVLDAGDSLAVTFGAIRLGLEPYDGAGLWDQARAVRARTAIAKFGVVVASAAAVTNHFVPPMITAPEVRGFVHQAIDYELLVSNLGAPAVDSSGPVRPRAIWGPMVMGQYENEQMVGVTTLDGCLRVTVTAHQDPAELTIGLEEALRRTAAGLARA